MLFPNVQKYLNIDYFERKFKSIFTTRKENMGHFKDCSVGVDRIVFEQV